MKKIVCLIDSLGSGGAQRQMVYLCNVLDKAGYEVTLITYFKVDEFFNNDLADVGIRHVSVYGKSKVLRFCRICREIIKIAPIAVISYLNFPNIVNEICGIWGNWRVIVSERVGIPTLSMRYRVSFHLHRLADVVVCNSWDFSDKLKKMAPRLESKVNTIINTVDLTKFSTVVTSKPIRKDDVEIIIVASFQKKKNPANVVAALHHLLHKNLLAKVHISWYGNNLFENGYPTPRSQCYLDTLSAIKDRNLEAVFLLHEPVREIIRVYHSADAVMLPSFIEGFPNVICEAMACGKPILASNVCDHARLVKEGKNGFLFDPQDPTSIAEAINKFIVLSPEEREAMGQESRRMAEELFGGDHFLKSYVAVIEGRKS